METTIKGLRRLNKSSSKKGVSCLRGMARAPNFPQLHERSAEMWWSDLAYIQVHAAFGSLGRFPVWY